MISCPECGSDSVMCLETGIEINSKKFNDKVFGDLFKCKNCRRRFITGLGLRAFEWYP